jgi:predicted nucleic acid-binding protein
MSVLLDTNVLLRLAESNHPMHGDAVQAVAILLGGGESLSVVSQIFYEFWVVATRPPGINGLGLSPARTESELAKIKLQFSTRDDVPDVRLAWESLVVKYQVVGKNAHDTRLVAAMIVHGIPRILTFNTTDFQRYQEITAISPADVLNAVAKGGTP